MAAGLALGSVAEGRGAVARVERVSVSSAGAPANGDSADVHAMSADRRVVAFSSRATNLAPSEQTGPFGGTYVRDRAARTTRGVRGGSVSLSADGRFIAFISNAADLVPGDTNGLADVFVQDLQTGAVERVSVSSTGEQADGFTERAVLSANGQVVLFHSRSTNLVSGDTNNLPDLFVRDRTRGTTERVNLSTAGAQANDFTDMGTLSADGRFVAFSSRATNIVPVIGLGEFTGAGGVYVRDRLQRTSERVSISAAGRPIYGGSDPSISADGRFVAMQYEGNDQTAGDTNGQPDIFVRDRTEQRTERVSLATGGAQGDAAARDAVLSADGRYVAFISTATTLVPGAANGFRQVFLRDRIAGTTEVVSRDPFGAVGEGDSDDPVLSTDGRAVLFSSSAANLVAGDTNGVRDTFVAERAVGPAARLAVFRPGTGEWLLRGPDGSGTTIAFGAPGDRPVPAAYLEPGVAQIAVFRPNAGEWLLRGLDGLPIGPLAFGRAGDIPAPAEYLGTGRSQIAVFRPHTQEWWIRDDAGSAVGPVRFGRAGDLPVPADYLGTGRAQLAVFRASTRRIGLRGGTPGWLVRGDDGTVVGPIAFGAPGDVPVPADYLGLGRAQLAVFRPATAEWRIRGDDGTTRVIPFGNVGDLPLPGDYTGGGRAQIAVYRPSTGEWFLRQEDGSTVRLAWGGPGDLPVPAAYPTPGE